MKKLLTSGILVGGIVLSTYLLTSQQPHQSDTISQSAPELGPRAHRLLPNLRNASVVVPNRPHDPHEVFSEDKAETIKRTRMFKVTTNALGFRDKAVEPVKVPRIVCVGDSVTFGWGVEDQNAYPSLLEKTLGVDVINTGVPALKPDHIEAYIASFVDTLKPDLVLIAMRPNWMTPNPLMAYTQTMKRVQYTLEKKGIHFGLIIPPLASFDPKGRSNNGREIQHIRNSLKEISILDLTPVFDAGLPDGGVSLVIESGKQKVVDRTSGEVLVEGNFPSPPRSLAPEIVELFEADESIKEPLFFDGGHPDKEGFILFASAVNEWVTAQGWIETAQ